MDETIVVVALDAADHRLVDRWDCDNMQLDSNGPLETFAHGSDVPKTVEVWPTVATGVGPEEHGLVAESQDAQDWDNPALRVASSLTRHFPSSLRDRLGELVSAWGEEKRFAQTDVPHVFEDGAVFGWPGIAEADHLAAAWNLMYRTTEEERSQPSFEAEAFGYTGKEFAWASRMADSSAPIVGVHSHILDVLGHAYADDEAQLEAGYTRVDRLLGWLRSEVGRLVVLSDHGMRVDWLDDDPGSHSVHATFATTDDGPLPGSVYDVHDWLAERKPTPGTDESVDFATTADRLRDLGYVE